jgi:predicted DNA-binding antitoxin AbrB/MazE fold protein
MKETLEAIYENGLLRPLKKLSFPEGRRVRVTLESEPEDETPELLAEEEKQQDFADLAGSLKDSPRFGGDPLAIQKRLRDEWS